MRAIAAMAVTLALVAAPVQAAEDDDDGNGDGKKPVWRTLTSFFVSPESPHQNDVIRVLLHCPDAASHAIVGSTAFPIKGSWRTFREVGVGLTGRNFGRRGIIISRFAPPGHHEVRMKCVKVRIDRKKGIRKVKVISRASASLTVRPFHIGQYF
ncbi:hypothetical protein ACFMQL_05545 [Nonomuraea fastidiosa]|jgi:hypothetical protein|uniref:hypothetical protein n=1 Tax=Nonomuraea TaxID=83681 RepID=UPI0032569AE8